MPEHEARSRAVYDHDNEEPRPAGRRRRQVADWGVGEEMFDHLPGRRFERRSHTEIPRGDAGDGRRTIVIETVDDEVPAQPAPPADEEFASREEALRAREAHDELWAGEEPFADDRAPADELWAEDEPFADDRAPAGESWDDEGPFGDGRSVTDGVDAAAEAWVAADESALAANDFEVPPGVDNDGIARGNQTGRRTVKIGGRPEFHGPPARARQRPPRAIHERLGPRPDRVAMWAFALGLLLILIAIATANA